MRHIDVSDIFADLCLFDAVVLYRRAILGESYAAIGKRLGFSYEDIRNRYSIMIKQLRGRLGNGD